MQKPSTYDGTISKRPGEYKQLPPGGYVCKIKSAREENTQKGTTMLVIAFDIEEGEYRNFFVESFNNDQRPNKKWPNGGIYRQMTGEKSIGFFKAMVEDIEASNPGYVWNWDEGTLKGKLFGGVFGREEYFNTSKGEYAFSTKCVYIRTADEVRSGIEPPPDKLADRTKGRSSETPYTSSAIDSVLDDDDLPF